MSDPLTIVEEETRVSFAELEHRVEETRRLHGETLQAFHRVWYNAPHTWHYTHFLGVGMMKCPLDLWIYQALLNVHKPRTVIETGTYAGASALWFAFLFEMLGIDGHVYTVDLVDRRRCDHQRITFLGGDSTDPAIVNAIAEQIEPPVLVVLDSDHAARHVRRELELYAPLVPVGDWLVVEDTNIAWGEFDVPEGEDRATYPSQHPGFGDRGARGGLVDYLSAHPDEFRQDILCERYLLTMNPGGWLQRVRPCDHGGER